MGSDSKPKAKFNSDHSSDQRMHLLKYQGPIINTVIRKVTSPLVLRALPWCTGGQTLLRRCGTYLPLPFSWRSAVFHCLLFLQHCL